MNVFLEKTVKKEFKIELLSKMLGTVPKNKEVYAAYIATKDKEKEEVETVEEIEEKGWTGFHQDDNGLFLYNYMVLGFLKSACEVAQAGGIIKKIPAYKKWLDKIIVIEPRRLYFGTYEADGIMERPLRAMTAKGERISVARSDYMAEGKVLEFVVKIIPNKCGIDVKTIETLLQYGEVCGLGQWRGSGGYGKFKVV